MTGADLIVTLAARHKLPAVYFGRFIVAAGGTIRARSGRSAQRPVLLEGLLLPIQFCPHCIIARRGWDFQEDQDQYGRGFWYTPLLETVFRDWSGSARAGVCKLLCICKSSKQMDNLPGGM